MENKIYKYVHFLAYFILLHIFIYSIDPLLILLFILSVFHLCQGVEQESCAQCVRI